MKITIHTNVDKKYIEAFDLQYKGCRTRFIENALRLAANNRELFDKIFFCDLLSSSDVIARTSI